MKKLFGVLCLVGMSMGISSLSHADGGCDIGGLECVDNSCYKTNGMCGPVRSGQNHVNCECIHDTLQDINVMSELYPGQKLTINFVEGGGFTVDHSMP